MEVVNVILPNVIINVMIMKIHLEASKTYALAQGVPIKDNLLDYSVNDEFINHTNFNLLYYYSEINKYVYNIIKLFNNYFCFKRYDMLIGLLKINQKENQYY